MKQAVDRVSIKFKDWISIKYYQYELNTGIYMLEPWEKSIFNFVLLGFLLLSVLSSCYFMPSSIRRGVGLLGL